MDVSVVSRHLTGADCHHHPYVANGRRHTCPCPQDRPQTRPHATSLPLTISPLLRLLGTLGTLLGNSTPYPGTSMSYGPLPIASAEDAVGPALDLTSQTARCPRGAKGRLATARLLASRFDRWERGDFGSLVAEWSSDCAKKSQQRHTRRSRPADPERDIKAAVALLPKGTFSNAAKLLESHGLADISDPVVLQQMLTKHPRRRTAMPPSHAWLASSFVNGDLPPWFYFVFCAARCVPLRKCAAQVGVAEAARPIGISCALRRGLTKEVFLNKGLRGGTKLIFGVRELLENPHFCIAGSDIYNAFNEGDRAEM
ncbi:hypothetical protein T492DRAFT_981019, partial [Pavlovales sp. CCMP2436]